MKTYKHKSGDCAVCPRRGVTIIARGMCRNCYDQWLKAHNPAYRVRQRRNHDAWAKRHAAQLTRYHREYMAGIPPAARWAKALRAKYGMTPQDYTALLTAQDGKCAICKRPPGKRRLHVDHDHKTGEIRGLLCFRCNFGLSWFGEDATRLAQAADYLNASGVGIYLRKLSKRGPNTARIHVGFQNEHTNS